MEVFLLKGAGRYPHIMRAVLGRPWAIDEESLAWAAICDVLALRAAGETLSEADITARIEAAANGPRSGAARQGALAIVPLYGVISPRANLMSRTSGGTTAEEFGAAFSAALRDPDIGSILIDVDSPGGQVEGIDEVATLIREARGVKPTTAIAYHVAASAALWIAAQADELVVTPSGSVGSVGVLYKHQDISEAEAKSGIRTTFISTARYKTEQSSHGPLTDEAAAHIRAEAEAWDRKFVSALATARGVSVDTVRADFGQGRMLRAEDAVRVGMADRVDTYDATVRRLLGAGRRVPGVESMAALAAGLEEARPKVAAAAEATAAAIVDPLTQTPQEPERIRAGRHHQLARLIAQTQAGLRH